MKTLFIYQCGQQKREFKSKIRLYQYASNNVSKYEIFVIDIKHEQLSHEMGKIGSMQTKN